MPSGWRTRARRVEEERVEEERLVDTGARRAQGGTFIHLVSARGGNWRTAAAVDGMEDGSGRRRHGGRQRPSTAWRTAAAVDGTTPQGKNAATRSTPQGNKAAVQHCGNTIMPRADARSHRRAAKAGHLQRYEGVRGYWRERERERLEGRVRRHASEHAKQNTKKNDRGQ